MRDSQRMSRQAFLKLRGAGLAGPALLGVALWRSGTLPRWTGVLYAVAVPLIAVVGLAVGVAQPVGAVLLIVSGAWIARTVWARPVRARAGSHARS